MKKVLFIMFALMTTTWAYAQTDDQLALKKSWIRSQTLLM